MCFCVVFLCGVWCCVCVCVCVCIFTTLHVLSQVAAFVLMCAVACLLCAWHQVVAQADNRRKKRAVDREDPDFRAAEVCCALSLSLSPSLSLSLSLSRCVFLLFVLFLSYAGGGVVVLFVNVKPLQVSPRSNIRAHTHAQRGPNAKRMRKKREDPAFLKAEVSILFSSCLFVCWFVFFFFSCMLQVCCLFMSNLSAPTSSLALLLLVQTHVHTPRVPGGGPPQSSRQS